MAPSTGFISHQFLATVKSHFSSRPLEDGGLKVVKAQRVQACGLADSLTGPGIQVTWRVACWDHVDSNDPRKSTLEPLPTLHRETTLTKGTETRAQSWPEKLDYGLTLLEVLPWTPKP